MCRLFLRFLPLLLALPFLLTHAHAARHALVIGNDTYTHITPLKNARADARAIAKTLEGSGFKVTLALDQNRSGMNAALRRFKNSLAGGDEAVFYYSGHGLQLGGANYLLPTDLRDEDEDQIKDDAVQLQRVLDDFAEQKARFSLAIIDACRDNPFKGQGKRNLAARGLAPTNAANGQMVIFSAGAGQQALDKLGEKDKAQNGLFTRVLLKEIEKGGQPVDRVLKVVRTEVVRLAKTVGHEQVPAIYDQSVGDFYFKRGAEVALASPSAVLPEMPALNLPSAESELWTAVQTGSTVEDFDTYLSQYPAGHYAAEAKRQMSRLKDVERVAVAQKEKIDWANAEKLASLDGYRVYLDAYPQGTYSALAQARLKKLESAGPQPGKTFRDCLTCPEMVGIPAGSFDMGSPGYETGRKDNEGPVHRVSVPAFALGKMEVTRGEWSAFVREASYSTSDRCWIFNGTKWEEKSGSWKEPGYAQNDSHPVVCVNWNDAQAYVDWLVKKTGKPYRLPTEAEWEYAARAGSTTARPWGDDADQACRYANIADQSKGPGGIGWTTKHECNDGYWYTAPTGNYQPNSFGLHDMIGNVWEWTQDCWNESYSGAPSNGDVRSSSFCEKRVLRSGSWNFRPLVARSAYRAGNLSSGRNDSYGFRVALDLSSK